METTELEPEPATAGLLAGDVDLVVGQDFPDLPGPWPPGVDVEPLAQDALVPALPPAERDTGLPGRLEELAAAAWVMDPPDTVPGRWARNRCREAGFEPDVRYTTPDLLLQVTLVHGGHAVALLPALPWAGCAPQVRLEPLPERPARRILTLGRSAGGRPPGEGRAPGRPARGGGRPARLRSTAVRQPGERDEQEDPRRATPRTDRVLADPRLRAATGRLGPALVRAAVTDAQQRCRDGELAPGQVPDAAVAALPPSASSLRPVLNATGVVVHTNLGRAPLSAAAVEALTRAAGTTDVELDLATGRRGPRGRGALTALRAAVPAAEAVHVVNNGAAALALAAATLAAGREVVVARGELVEIGDGFRIPELLQAAGARLREVGTTNRVHLRDYADAVTEETALVLKVHPSNFQVSGFTSSVPVRELAGLPVPVVVDIGSGLLAPHRRLPDEPDAASVLVDGAALVTASGDKLLGGPQCGLLLGREEVVHRLRRHPLARALRVDKLTLAALEATLCGPVPPTAAMLALRPEDLRPRAEAVAARLAGHVDVAVVESAATVGGGGAPGVELPSVALSLPAHLAAPLRDGDPPVVARVRSGRLLLDLLSVAEDDDDRLVAAVAAAARSAAAPPATGGG